MGCIIFPFSFFPFFIFLYSYHISHPIYISPLLSSFLWLGGEERGEVSYMGWVKIWRKERLKKGKALRSHMLTPEVIEVLRFSCLLAALSWSNVWPPGNKRIKRESTSSTSGKYGQLKVREKRRKIERQNGNRNAIFVSIIFLPSRSNVKKNDTKIAFLFPFLCFSIFLILLSFPPFFFLLFFPISYSPFD